MISIELRRTRKRLKKKTKLTNAPLTSSRVVYSASSTFLGSEKMVSGTLMPLPTNVVSPFIRLVCLSTVPSSSLKLTWLSWQANTILMLLSAKARRNLRLQTSYCHQCRNQWHPRQKCTFQTPMDQRLQITRKIMVRSTTILVLSQSRTSKSRP